MFYSFLNIKRNIGIISFLILGFAYAMDEGARNSQTCEEALAHYQRGLRYEKGLGIEKNGCEAIHCWMESKLPEARDKIYSFLDIPYSFGEKRYSFDFEKDYFGSFKDMLNHILKGDKSVTGLANLAGTHCHKAQRLKDSKAGLSQQLYPYYEKVAVVEEGLCDLIALINEKSTPGFMVGGFPYTWNKIIGQSQFFLKHCTVIRFDKRYSSVLVGQQFYSFGQKNVLLAKRLIECLETIDDNCRIACNALKKIAELYKEEHKTLNEREFEDDPEVLFCGQFQLKNERDLLDQISKAESECRSLMEIQQKIKAILYFGKPVRTWEFFEAHPWLKI